MMSIKTLFAAAAVALLLGCSGQGGGGAASTPAASGTTAQSASTPTVAAAPHAYAQGSKKKGDKALCAVCAVNEGATEEEVAVETIDYEGKTYTFCNESEKATFISTPAKFASK
jgi:YHS domain-containing protein